MIGVQRQEAAAYEQMLAAVEDGELDAIVTWHNDRLHRSPRKLEAFIDLVERRGVRVAVVTGGDYDLTTPEGRFTARIVGAVARKAMRGSQPPPPPQAPGAR